MSGSQQKPWSSNHNAPKITHDVYLEEKANFTGNFLSSILYGIVIVVFFQCMAALFNPVHRRGEPIRWGLVSYAMIMFSAVTVGTTMQACVQSISSIDNREFPGVGGVLPPGPIGYQWIIKPMAISFVQNITFTLNNWLADGFLLYRCYVIYSKNLWVIAFPSLVYLGSLAMGVMFVYQTAGVTTNAWSVLPYLSISLSLNVLVTLVIVIRLILHAGNTRTALGGAGIGGLCKAIVVMLVESCALYAVSSLLFIGPLGAGSFIMNVFLPILAETQVIASLLIIKRVANKSALTSNTLVSGRINSFKAGSRWEATGGSITPPRGDPTSSVGENGIYPGGLVDGDETTIIDFHQDKI